MKTIREEERPLLARKEITIEVEFPKAATPKKTDLQKQIAAQFKAEESMVAVKDVHTEYGQNRALVQAFIYTDANQMKVLEAKKEKKAGAAKAAPAK